jgi:ABC-2 type transport system permease protein
MLHNLDIYRRLLRVQIRSQLAYRTSFLFDLAGTALITLFEFGALALAMQEFETIGGWTLAEVAFLYGLVEMGFALMDMIFTGFDPPFFGRQVRMGTFDQILLRPVPLSVQVLGSALELRRFGRIFFGGLLFIYALSSNDIQWTWQKILYLPLVELGIISLLRRIIRGRRHNRVLDGGEHRDLEHRHLRRLLYHLLSDVHLSQRLRNLFTYVLPAHFSQLLSGACIFWTNRIRSIFPRRLRFLSPVIGISLLLLAFRFWHFGVRQYQSTGT